VGSENRGIGCLLLGEVRNGESSRRDVTPALDLRCPFNDAAAEMGDRGWSERCFTDRLFPSERRAAMASRRVYNALNPPLCIRLRGDGIGGSAPTPFGISAITDAPVSICPLYARLTRWGSSTLRCGDKREP
jgi:hypothetical protein